MATQPMAQPVPGQIKQQQEDFVTRISGHMRRMLMFRKQYDQKRSALYRQYLSQRTQPTFPDNITKRSNTFVPYSYSTVETVVSRVDDAFFSNYPFFETRGRGAQDDVDNGQSPSKADSMQFVLDYMLHLSRLQPNIQDLVRTIGIYGHGGIKVDWDWDYETINGPEPVYAMQVVPQMQMGPQGPEPVMQDGKPVPQIDPQTGKPATQPMTNPMTGQPMQIGTKMVTKQVPRMRPKFIPIDTYDLLVDPDGSYVACLTEKSIAQIEREAQVNPQLYFPEGIAELKANLAKEKNPQDVIIRLAEFWDNIENTVCVITVSDDRDAITWKDMRASMRNASYSGFKRNIYGGKPVLLYQGPNPFAHKRNPILHTSYTKLPNEVYGVGAVESISDLNESLNVMTNMVVDNWNLGINKRYAYDVNADIDHTALNSFNIPGGKVGVNGDPNKVLSPLPSFTPTAGDYQILDLFKGMIEMTSGVSDFYNKGVGSAGGNRTATGIQQVIGESNFKFRMFIRNLELDIFQPLLEMCASMVQQFCSDEVEYMITDAPPGIPKYGTVKLEELIGNYDFIIVAANYAQNMNIRQRQMLAFANVAAESGYILERPALLELAKTFQIPHAQRFLKTEQQLQQEQMGQQQAQIQARNEEWQHEADMMILQAMLNIKVQQNTPVQVKNPNGTTSIKIPGPGQGAGGGRPRGMQKEGPMAGGGMSSAIRDFAQSMGANSMGLGQMGEANGG